MPKPAWEMAKKRARSHQVGRQKHSAKYLQWAEHSCHLVKQGCMQSLRDASACMEFLELTLSNLFSARLLLQDGLQGAV